MYRCEKRSTQNRIVIFHFTIYILISKHVILEQINVFRAILYYKTPKNSSYSFVSNPISCLKMSFGVMAFKACISHSTSSLTIKSIVTIKKSLDFLL